MARKLDKILVIDIEATCWDGDPPQGQSQVSEIIEIGVCPIVLSDLHIEDAIDILVKPQRSEISEYCTNLTTLTPETLENGISFQEACALLKRSPFKSSQRTWASWGDYDRRQFERQCNAWEMSYPFGATHLNIKNLFALSYGLTREVGMDKALERMGLELEGTHHRAHDDAANIAKILAGLIWQTRASS